MLLLGLTGFLHFERKKRYWLAGLFLALLAIKPHLLYLVCLAIFVWSLGQRRRWTILGGASIVLVSTTLVALAFNPHVIEQYMRATLDPKITSQYWSTTPADSPLLYMTPTLGTLLRLIFGSQHTWLQYVPMVGGVVWLALYGMRYRKEWVWADRISLLLLACVVTAPLGWHHDLVILILIVLEVTCLVLAGRSTRIVWKLALPLHRDSQYRGVHHQQQQRGLECLARVVRASFVGVVSACQTMDYTCC